MASAVLTKRRNERTNQPATGGWKGREMKGGDSSIDEHTHTHTPRGECVALGERSKRDDEKEERRRGGGRSVGRAAFVFVFSNPDDDVMDAVNVVQ